jgi:hypothetical protein
MIGRSLRPWVLGLIGVVAVAPAAPACNVPVFRYALERWVPDAFEFFVYHRGPLTGAELARVTELERVAESDSGPGRANVQFIRVDLATETDPDLLAIYKANKEPALPWLLVRYPVHTPVREDLWTGPLGEAPVAELLDSPARREIVRRLLRGDTAVWVLLESGDAEKDDAVARLLEEQARELPKVLKLPDLSDSPADELLRPETLRIAFSHVRIAPTDAAERWFVHILRHTEEDLPTGEPMVFPVFGRGRTLLALVGAGITKENIQQDGDFLVGPCSCEVKRMNPGADLLMTADWEAGLTERVVKTPDVPELSGLERFLAAGQPTRPEPEKLAVMPLEEPEETGATTAPAADDSPAVGPATATPPPAASADRPSPLLRNVLLALAGGLVLLGATTWILWRGKNRLP